MRTHFTELPTYKELCDIFASEDRRVIPKSKESAHYGEFSTMIRLLEFYNLPTTFFSRQLSFKDLDNQSLYLETVTVFNNVVKNVLLSKDNLEVQRLGNNIYDYLSEEDMPEKSDLLFVYGSKTTIRIEKAIELYKSGFAPKIVISGKSPFYEKDVIFSESEKLADFAIKNGVPSQDIILEKEATSIPDNVKRTLNLLQKYSIKHDSIILINSPFAQRRGYAHFSKMCREKTKLFRVNSSVSSIFSRNEWYRNEVGVKTILKEFFSMRIGVISNTA